MTTRFYVPKGFEHTDKTPLIGLGCGLVGMHSIASEAAAREYHFRAVIWSLAGQDDFLDVSYNDIAAHIGLSTDVKSLSRPEFLRRVSDRLVTAAMACRIYGDAEIHSILP